MRGKRIIVPNMSRSTCHFMRIPSILLVCDWYLQGLTALNVISKMIRSVVLRWWFQGHCIWKRQTINRWANYFVKMGNEIRVQRNFDVQWINLLEWMAPVTTLLNHSRKEVFGMNDKRQFSSRMKIYVEFEHKNFSYISSWLFLIILAAVRPRLFDSFHT